MKTSTQSLVAKSILITVILGGGAEAVSAASLNGSASIIGGNRVDIESADSSNISSIQFDFSDGFSEVISASGSFTQLSPSTLTVTNLTFEPAGAGYVSTNPTAAIDFGQQTIDGVTDNLTFTVEKPIQIVLAGGNFVTENPFEGFFSHGGMDTPGKGSLVTQSVPTDSPTYSMTLAAVPEPLTLLGSGAALAMGIWLKLR
ncbi:MAG: PEP-CTERM sorting domain-containing protein [Cyanobacteria bacterium P01_H01_bin.58]